MYIIGIDFSITKPAACVYYLKNSTQPVFDFFIWPRKDSLSNSKIESFRGVGINVIERADIVNPHKDSSLKMRFVIENSIYLSALIQKSLLKYLGDQTYISYEGFSYASSGDAVLQLSGYKYSLMKELSQYTSLHKTFTYAPQTLKKTAGCSKISGKGKIPMIDSFLDQDLPLANGSLLNKEITSSLVKFKTKSASGKYIEGLDDLADSYWAIRTLMEKENLSFSFA